MSTITVLEPRQLERRPGHLIPLAMIAMSVSEFTTTYGDTFEHETDDLDGYSVLYLGVDGRTVALKRYDGEPTVGITIYAEGAPTPKSAEKIVNKVLKHYHISRESLAWQEQPAVLEKLHSSE